MYGRWPVGEKSWDICKSCGNIHRCMVGGLWERRVGIYKSCDSIHRCMVGGLRERRVGVYVRNVLPQQISDNIVHMDIKHVSIYHILIFLIISSHFP